MNAVATNLRVVGASPEALLLTTALDLLQKNTFDKAAGQFVQALQKDPKMLRALAESYLAHLSGQSPTKSPDADHFPHDEAKVALSASGDTSEDAGDQNATGLKKPSQHMSPASSPSLKVAAKSNRASTKSQRQASLKVVQAISASVFESFLLRGQKIGTLTIAELRDMKKLNVKDNKLIDQILNNAANITGDRFVKDTVTKSQLKAMIEKAGF